MCAHAQQLFAAKAAPTFRADKKFSQRISGEIANRQTLHYIHSQRFLQYLHKQIVFFSLTHSHSQTLF